MLSYTLQLSQLRNSEKRSDWSRNQQFTFGIKLIWFYVNEIHKFNTTRYMIHDDSLQSIQYIFTKFITDIHFNVIPHVHLKSSNLVSELYISFCSPYI